MSHEPPKYKTTKFQNWGKNINCEVDQIWEPETKEDLIWIVKKAYEQKKKVRAVGDGHSWAPMWFQGKDKNAWIVKSNKLNHKGWDNVNKRIIAGPGVPIGEIMKLELAVGHCIPVQVVLQEVMIGGVIGTGCHGTGLERHTVSDYVYSMTLILWDGTEREITKADGDLFDAVKSGFGAFGLVWEIKFDTVPQPIVRVRDYKVPVSDVYDVNNPAKLKEWVTTHDYVEVFWFPLNTKDQLWIKTFKYANDKIPDDKPTIHQRFGLLAVPASHFFAFIENKIPRWVPKVSDAFLLGLDNQDAVQHLSYAMHFQDYLDDYAAMLDTEICIEISDDYSNVVEAFTSIINITREWEKKGKYPLNVCLECRFIANSDALLSPAYGPKGSHHCYIEIISYDGTPGFDEYMRECLVPWFTQKKWNAIPHLGKYWQRLNDPEIGFDIEDYVRKQMGERFTRFVEVRDEIDPHGLFLNKFLDSFFHPRKTKGIENGENEHIATILAGVNEKFARAKSPQTEDVQQSHA